MLVQTQILSSQLLHFKRLVECLGVDNLVLAVSPEIVPNTWAFYRKGISVTMFLLEKTEEEYILTMDELASYEDYAFFPYLLDTLHFCLTGHAFEYDGMTAFQIYDEEWIADAMGEEVAMLKCFLSLGLRYHVALPIEQANVYIDNEVLNHYGVCVYSSTPRIFGYVTYLLRHGLLPADEDINVQPEDMEEIMVDVPQHHSIGTVLSWQTDGSETTESYSLEDVELLQKIAGNYAKGMPVDGVVLNDVGTLYEHGIGVEANAEIAIYWYKEAIKNGDRLYAPTSLGDIYRRGAGIIKPDLQRAIEAYRCSEDPYAWYRIGQSYEEGWVSEADMEKAMSYYRKAAAARHHLALKRLGWQ